MSRSRPRPVRKGGEKTTLTQKRGCHVHNVFLRSYRCIRNLSPSMADAAATAYTHFGNAKPKFNMNCWPTISINDRSCQQRSTGPANFLTCTYSFIFTITKVLANSRGMHTRTVIFTHSKTHIEQNYSLPRIAYLARARQNKSKHHLIG